MTDDVLIWLVVDMWCHYSIVMVSILRFNVSPKMDNPMVWKANSVQVRSLKQSNCASFANAGVLADSKALDVDPWLHYFHFADATAVGLCSLLRLSLVQFVYLVDLWLVLEGLASSTLQVRRCRSSREALVVFEAEDHSGERLLPKSDLRRHRPAGGSLMFLIRLRCV